MTDTPPPMSTSDLTRIQSDTPAEHNQELRPLSPDVYQIASPPPPPPPPIELDPEIIIESSLDVGGSIQVMKMEDSPENTNSQPELIRRTFKPLKRKHLQMKRPDMTKREYWAHKSVKLAKRRAKFYQEAKDIAKSTVQPSRDPAFDVDSLEIRADPNPILVNVTPAHPEDENTLVKQQEQVTSMRLKPNQRTANVPPNTSAIYTSAHLDNGRVVYVQHGQGAKQRNRRQTKYEIHRRKQQSVAEFMAAFNEQRRSWAPGTPYSTKRQMKNQKSTPSILKSSVGETSSNLIDGQNNENSNDSSVQLIDDVINSVASSSLTPCTTILQTAPHEMNANDHLYAKYDSRSKIYAPKLRARQNFHQFIRKNRFRMNFKERVKPDFIPGSMPEHLIEKHKKRNGDIPIQHWKHNLSEPEMKMVARVLQHFQDRGVTNPHLETAVATGIARSTVMRIKKYNLLEPGATVPVKQKRKRPSFESTVSDDNYGRIKEIIMEIIRKREFPTLDNVLLIIKEKIPDFPYNRTTFNKVLTRLNIAIRLRRQPSGRPKTEMFIPNDPAYDTETETIEKEKGLKRKSYKKRASKKNPNPEQNEPSQAPNSALNDPNVNGSPKKRGRKPGSKNLSAQANQNVMHNSHKSMPQTVNGHHIGTTAHNSHTMNHPMNTNPSHMGSHLNSVQYTTTNTTSTGINQDIMGYVNMSQPNIDQYNANMNQLDELIRASLHAQGGTHTNTEGVLGQDQNSNGGSVMVRGADNQLLLQL